MKILALVQGYTKLVDRSSVSDDDDVTKQLRVKEQMLNDHTQKCRRMNKMNKMNIQLGNLTLPEQLEKKALNNENIFEQEIPLLNKSSVENDPLLIFD